MKIQERIIVTTSLLIVCGSMFFSWFGGSRGVQELSGTIVLLHPVTISCILAILIGVWAGGPKYSFLLTNLGFLGIVLFLRLAYRNDQRTFQHYRKLPNGIS